jgi:flagellar biosynthesis protein FlhB
MDFVLSITKKIMTKHKMFLMKMALDNPTNNQVILNYEHVCDLQIMFGLSCILSLLKFVHVLIKFAQSKDVFVHDLVVAIEVYQGDFSNINCD